MKKINNIFIVFVVIVFMTVGCAGSTAQRAIKESKNFMNNGDYEAALGYLNIAKNEGADNDEIDEMILIIENYNKAMNAFNEDNISEANEAIGAVPESYKNYGIAGDVDILKNKIIAQQTIMSDIDLQISGTKKLIADGDYVSAQENIKELYVKELTEEQKKQVDEMDKTIKSANSKINEAANSNSDGGHTSQTNSSSSIMSNRSLDEIESYISSYVRPLYQEVQSNLDSYSVSNSNGITYWHDGKGYIKKKLDAGINGYNYNREYYYDTDSGRIAFAFIYNGSEEYRLYFRTNQLIRYIDSDGAVENNPVSNKALNMGNYVISEAY